MAGEPATTAARSRDWVGRDPPGSATDRLRRRAADTVGRRHRPRAHETPVALAESAADVDVVQAARLEPTGPPLNFIAFLGNLAVAVGTLVGVPLLIWGTR